MAGVRLDDRWSTAMKLVAVVVEAEVTKPKKRKGK
jgi:hypothetical protein